MPGSGTPPRAGTGHLLSVLIGRRDQCRVEGDSMLPALADGDRVIVRRWSPVPSSERRDLEPLVGAIVVLQHPLEPGTRLVKRVRSVCGAALDVRGDNASASRDSRQFGLVSAAALQGVVEAVLPRRALRAGRPPGS
ncbi:nickel-type superoxide dismutase maturation protease [Synechococcus sp. RSCCF101]|uniref:nickel-type superoxide dismutase maturation protease n=1 Tax=Synechococcus sp. RSCCF101 TaxID=2511069 RepID=UPI0012482CBD|nr:nickel-type superoxide dismutase maturation protease [Synechococcus sp. RSCCF101]QEY31927.1 nickel-type superoxide dismutase maturation protease [Synechococcus sp. RSCCF101]